MIAWKVVELGSGLESLHDVAFLYIFPENDNSVNYDYSDICGTHCLTLDLQLETAKLCFFVTLFSFIKFFFYFFGFVVVVVVVWGFFRGGG